MKKLSILVTLLFSFFISSNTFAEGRISYIYTNRINSINNDFLTNNSWELEGNKSTGKFRYNAKVNYQGSELGAMYSLSEIYYEKNKSNSSYWFGRKILNWEKSEKHWNLGMLNPQVGFNLMDLNREGLVGLGVSKKIKSCNVELTVSPLNIPQMNPIFITKKGKIIGKNEWSTNPPTKVIFNGVDTPIEYEVINPKISDIVGNLSYGGYVSCGKKTKFSSYAISKAENQIRLNANGALDALNDRVFVQAKPFISKHNILGTSISHNWKKHHQAYMSYYRIIPQKEKIEAFEFESLKIEPVYTVESYGTLSYQYQNSRGKISGNYIHTFEGRNPLDGIFTKKAYWLDAANISIDYRLSERIKLKGSYTYDFSKKDVLTSFDANIKFNKHFSSEVGAIFLDVPNDSSFWANYKSNDSIYTKVSYIF